MTGRFYMKIYGNLIASPLLLCDQWADSTLTHNNDNDNADSGSSHWSRYYENSKGLNYEMSCSEFYSVALKDKQLLTAAKAQK